MRTRAAKWIANAIASNLVWLLLSGSLGAAASAALKAMGALSNPYGLVSIGFLVAAICVAIVQKIQGCRSLPNSSEQLTLTLYNALRDERERAAQQLAKEEVDRELKGLK
jgi:hypothetical protein